MNINKILLVILCAFLCCVFLARCSAGDGNGTPSDVPTQDRTDESSGEGGDPNPDIPSDRPLEIFDGSYDLGEIPDDCIPPEALIILDRTMSMHFATGGTPKWLVALEAIGSMLSAYPETVWWGLELFPRDHEQCVTLEERIAGTLAQNPECEDGEVVIPPGPGTADAINSRLAETLLCRTTPIEQACSVARTWFEAHPPDIPGRHQVVIFIGDGKETCGGNAPCPVTAMHALGIRTYVIGFGDEVDPLYLSSMACAGGTASDPDLCDSSDPACVVSDPTNTSQFYLAEDTEAFRAALNDIAAEINCGGMI